MNRETRNHLIWICLLWVVFSAIGEFLVQMAIDGWPLIGSEEGMVTNEAIFFLFRATVPIFTLVVLILGYSAVRFRVPQDDTRSADAQYATGHLFIGVWVALSVVINVFFIVHPGTTGLISLWNQARAAAAADPLLIDVTAKQWQWEFSYPQYGIDTVNELVVPVDRPIKFTLKSDDVIHSFWVPAWGLKKAVIPGDTRTLFITPTVAVTTAEDPTARVQCAQICGVGHAVMRSSLQVLAEGGFADWVNQKKMAAAGDGQSMPGMDMSGEGANMKMDNGSTPGMDMPADSGAATDVNASAMPGMDMPADSSGTPAMSGSSMPGMDMSGTPPTKSQSAN